MARSARIQVVAAGGPKPPLDAVIADYEGRIAKLAPFRADEVAIAATGGGAATAMRKEAERIRAKLQRGAWVVALSPDGRAPASSAAFGAELERRLAASRPLAFVIGGPLGLDPRLVAEADASLSLGPLTLPHQLARAVLAEQIYRALATAAGHPYAR